MTRPLLSLVMILKDEAAGIRSVLEDVRLHVDTWTILDTGSTDGTQDIVREVLKNVPGKLFEGPFVDYASARNRALDADQTDSVFQLVLSADEHLIGGPNLRRQLQQQVDSDITLFRLTIRIDDSSFPSPRIFRRGSGWRYEGVVHEVPFNRDKPDSPQGFIEGAEIHHIVSDYEKRFSTIWEHHIPSLQAVLDENPKDERALVFLASSYESLLPMMRPGERLTYVMTAMSLCLRRAELPFASEDERNYLRMKYLSLARQAGIYTNEEIFERCAELAKDDPDRPETALLLTYAAMQVLPVSQVYALATHATHVASKPFKSDAPVSTSCEWKAHHAAATAARWLAIKFPKEDVTGDGTTYEMLMRKHISAGIIAGGNWESFSPLAESSLPSDAA